MGDPSGVGPAIITRALAGLKLAAEYVVIGDAFVFGKTAYQKSEVRSQNFIDLNNVDRRSFSFGKVRAEYGRASIEYIDEALRLMGSSLIDCLVTCPVSKEAVNLSGVRFLGHTEYLAEHTKTTRFVMMLLNNRLKISLVSRHIPLAEVRRALSIESIRSNVQLSHAALKKLFVIHDPRIVVCGVNPHASDNGLIGKEEKEVIVPALKGLKKAYSRLEGPYPADTAISMAYKGRYDCVIAMYHDQALIPLKLFGAHNGVNLTLGLPFIRTSPLHGTGFDIASNPRKIDASSLAQAIRIAYRCALNQKKA